MLSRVSRSGTGGKAGALRVRLGDAGFELSRLGFGTSALMSRVNRRDSVRLLRTALECGVTHFDTARSYGFGEAESAVAEVLRGQRDLITVTTKVGILPPRRSAGLSAAKAVARGVLSVLPGMRAAVRRSAGSLVQAGRFDARSMEASLHASLRQLRTEYVDVLLLHEPAAEVLRTHEPLEFLERVRREGKVRAFGIAATAEVAAYALRETPAYPGLVQMPNSVFAPRLQELSGRKRVGFTHSAMGPSLAELRAALAQDAALRERWLRELQVDVLQPGGLERLALQYALEDLPEGCVLFTSTRPEHVRENAAVLRTAADPEQIGRFARLVQEWTRSGRDDADLGWA